MTWAGATSPRRALLALLLVTAACAPRRPVTPDVTAPGASAGYACAYRELQTLGYSIVRAAPEAGAVTGQRIVSEPLREPTVWDELVVAAPKGANATGRVRVTARGGARQGTRRWSVEPSGRGRADAERITERCRDARR